MVGNGRVEVGAIRFSYTCRNRSQEQLWVFIFLIWAPLDSKLPILLVHITSDRFESYRLALIRKGSSIEFRRGNVNNGYSKDKIGKRI